MDNLPKIKLRLHSNEVEDVARKLVAPGPRETNGVNADRRMPNMDVLGKLSAMTAGNINDADSIFQMLPETKTIETLIVSSVLSPNDMVKTHINFTVEDKELPADVTAALLAIPTKHFETTYKIKTKLAKWLSNALFRKGSVPLLILPENVIDNTINGVTTENLRLSIETIESATVGAGSGSLGYLGSGSRRDAPTTSWSASIENYTRSSSVPLTEQVNKDLMFRLSDDPAVLSLPKAISRFRAVKSEELLSGRFPNAMAKTTAKRGGATATDRHLSTAIGNYAVGKEDYNSANTASLLNTPNAYPSRSFKYSQLMVLDAEGASAGHPTVMELPAESFIPVHAVGDPTRNEGGFLLIDINGNPLSLALGSDYVRDMTANYTAAISSNNQVGNMLQTMRKAAFGFNESNNDELAELGRVHRHLVVEHMRRAMKNGLLGDSVELPNKDEFFKIMWARALAGHQTQVVYIPRELITYVAFDYNEMGIGCSLIERNKIIGSIRSMITFSDTMRSIRNAIGKSTLNITLDEHDPDPTATVEDVVHEFVRTRQARYPVGIFNPQSIVTYLQQAGVELNVTGNVGYPDTKAAVEDGQSSIALADTNLNDDLRKRYIMGFGVTPEQVDRTMDPEFAVSVVSNNLLLTKIVMLIQDLFAIYLTSHCRTYIKYDSKIINEMRERLTELLGDEYAEKGEEYIATFIKSFTVKLPEPDTSRIKAQMTEYEEVSKAIDAYLDVVLSTEILDENVVGEMTGSVESLKKSIAASYKRDWLISQNVLPNIGDLFAWGDGEEDVPDIVKRIISEQSDMLAVIKRFTDTRREELAQITKEQEEIGTKLEDEYGNPGTLSSNTSSGGSDDYDNDSEGDDFSDDDSMSFGGDDDTANSDEEEADAETPADEEEPVEEEEEAPEEEPAEEPAEEPSGDETEEEDNKQ